MSRPGSRGDAGLSLVELLVTMVVLGLFLGLFGTTLISVSRSARRQTAVGIAQQSGRDAFLLLDKQLRYADAVSAPGTAGGDQWIEWRVPDPAVPVATSATQTRCFQWRASSGTGLLQFRGWIVPTSGAAVTSGWQTVARDLQIGSQPVFTVGTTALQAAPFSLPSGARAIASPVRVGVSLSATSGSPAGRSSFVTVFTALNSGPATTAVCTEVGRS